MNQLNKLIEQYERENPGKKARKDIGHLITIYEDDFVLWLATRPTCGKEQRLFLDEIRELYEWNDHLGFPHLQRKEITKYSNIYQQDFKKTNLKKLVNE